MGEVWRAFDLKLRVDVALKALRRELFTSGGRLELLRQEVRAAREVVSPNVCRVFDLIELDGRELVSMEYIDGRTLLEVLKERGPLDLEEAQEIASQFLAGLEAIHRAGLVHRDIKPENIMLTRAGRVVVMDFGIARQEAEGSGTVSGTPAYMAPEQARGEVEDARADVYAAGVVLAEMVCPGGIKDLDSRKSLWDGVLSEPPKLPDSPWAPVLRHAVAKDREARYRSAHTLTRALEEVTLRVEGSEDLYPYPGLASFTEADAEYFFGREAEVEAMWRKLEGAPRLLGLVGPSGAGKTSFVRAGLIPRAGTSWRCLVCTPGNNPELALSRALASELTSEAGMADQLLRFDDPAVVMEVMSGWRRRSEHALLVVDQFEELFTQNAPEEQARFARTLGALALEADAHVLLSMRDDFLLRCHDHEGLKPLFMELTPLATPVGANLRRALTQPAITCGYHFEDDALVEEMLGEVEGERGALPLLAFAAARLWEKRDRESGLLTRSAFEDIGGVGGALARHAEATMDRIGSERIGIVREVFRNLVTAEGTRAVREWDELLSVFVDAQRDSAAEVLRELVDARLLTSYEVKEEDREPTRRVEIIHESLLAAWPRLVRWQAQDTEGALLRDQLRQAARTWAEHDRSDDLLWTGSAFREYAVWRERYAGGLTELEEAFGRAMTSLATRRRRRRRIAATIVVGFLAAVAMVLFALWRRSVQQTRRAEAQKLVALGKVRLEDYPTAALALGIQSLELADSEEARFLALEALWEGPTAFVVSNEPTIKASFSPRGDWLVLSHDFKSALTLVSRDGRQVALDHPSGSGTTRVYASFGGQEDHFFSWGDFTDRGRVALWSATQGRLLASARPVEDPYSPEFWLGFPNPGMIGPGGEDRQARFVMAKEQLVSVDALRTDGVHRRTGVTHTTSPVGKQSAVCMPRRSGEWFGLVDGSVVSIVKVGDEGLSDPIPLGRETGDLYPFCEADPLGRFLVTVNRAGEIKLWDSTGRREPAAIDGLDRPTWIAFSSDGTLLHASGSTNEGVSSALVWAIEDLTPDLLRRIEPVTGFQFIPDSGGPWLAGIAMGSGHSLYSLRAPDGADPILLRRGPTGFSGLAEFSPDGRWLAKTDESGLTLWPLTRPHAAVVRFENGVLGGLASGPDGRFLATSVGTTVSVWPLEGTVPPPGRVALTADTLQFRGLGVSPNGEWFAVGSRKGDVWIGRDGDPDPQRLRDPTANGSLDIAFSQDGQLVAALTGFYNPRTAVVRVWNVKTSAEVAVFRLSDAEFRRGSSFTSDGRLMTATSKGVVAWDVRTGDEEVVVDFDVGRLVASSDGRRLLVTPHRATGYMQDSAGSPVFFDLATGHVEVLHSHGSKVVGLALNRDGTVAVTADRNGTIRVGPVTGEEPHLLVGHDGDVYHLAIDPRGRWIASGGEDRSVRLWPMPDLSKAPLHTLPHDELIAKLKTLTNLRAVRDPNSSTGWTIELGPFPGWRNVPTW
jgi:WD40 repeat protein